ncbi:L-fucose operon activator [Acerihabitans arboris]|uniref:L-fucose operon activator n=1 Tax=Acerihabitans arboris TaxID=2691583 RepID=A0A845SA05_9GAMM|nr:L-fucose operon activator [Acerihabitans arboris]NDL61580.1 L-fucose operon activator [Acerihabitans arboris]
MKSTRQQDILALISQQEILKVDELAAWFEVSRETIRRDFNSLQEQGLIIRQHGRAKGIPRGKPDSGDSFNARVKSHLNSKAGIAAQALTWIDEEMVIALDASTTCWYLAKKLPDIPLTVFTNSVRVCRELEKKSRITLISSGGTLQRKYACYVNPALFSIVKHLDIDLFIFSCEGIDHEDIMWDSNAINADYKALLLNKATQSLLLMDKSKLRRRSTVKIGPLSLVERVISDTDRLKKT